MRMSIENVYTAGDSSSRVQSFPPPPILRSHHHSHPPPLPMRELRESSSKPHINPSVLVIVIILSVVFLCSGILHILARCLGRRRGTTEPGAGGLSSSPSNSIRGQLQHLFSLHDSGVEQVFIDTLPVFLYGSIRGLKDSADCAVCLNEFANEDKLRLLPKCKHAFHTECIDTWLLSNSTCPLCRRSLLPEAEPVFPEIAPSCTPPEEQLSGNSQQPHQQTHGSFRGSFRASLRGSFRFLTEAVAPPPPPPPPEAVPTPENVMPPMTPGPTVLVSQPDGSEKTLRVELGKVNVDSRRVMSDVGTSRMPRSYSMGSYEYVVDFSSLGLAMQPTAAPGSPSSKPMHRSTLSDGIPELSSASHTPGQEDMFWASRGLDTPRSLSRVREIMTPSPRWNSSPLFLGPPKQKQVVDEGGEIKVFSGEMSLRRNPNFNSDAAVETEMVQDATTSVPIRTLEEEDALLMERSLSLRLFPHEDHVEECDLLRSPIQELGAAARKDKVWEVSVDVSEPPTSTERSPSSKKSSPLNWLRGRGRRLVYSAASPSATDVQSTEQKSAT